MRRAFKFQILCSMWIPLFQCWNSLAHSFLLFLWIDKKRERNNKCYCDSFASHSKLWALNRCGSRTQHSVDSCSPNRRHSFKLLNFTFFASCERNNLKQTENMAKLGLLFVAVFCLVQVSGSRLLSLFRTFGVESSNILIVQNCKLVLNFHKCGNKLLCHYPTINFQTPFVRPRKRLRDANLKEILLVIETLSFKPKIAIKCAKKIISI